MKDFVYYAPTEVVFGEHSEERVASLTKKYGDIKPPVDLKAVGSPVDEEEYAYPDADKLPLDDPLKRYEEGDSYVGLESDLFYFINPFTYIHCIPSS